MALQSQMRCGTLDDIPGISDDIKRMYQILKRMESCQSIGSNISDFDITDDELDSDDEQTDGVAVADLPQRLEGINLDDANAIWSKLTDKERQGFENIVKSEDISSILPAFHPWWENKVQKVLIKEIGVETGTDDHHSTQDHPKIFESIADFSSISTKPPAPCVANNLVNVLTAYSMAVRFFAGDHLNSTNEASHYLLSICANLKTNANFNEPNLAIESIRYESHNEGFSIDEDDIQQAKKDVDNITEGPNASKTSNLYMLAALSDLRMILVSAKSARKPSLSPGETSWNTAPPKHQKKQFNEFVKRFADHKIIENSSVDKTKLTASIKKIEYYLAYVKKFR